MKNRITINENNYNKIYNLLNCKDEPSINIGLSILEESDINKSIIYILYLLKQMEFSNLGHLRQDDYPKLVQHFIDNFDGDFKLSYKQIYDIAKEKSLEEKTFIANKFGNELKEFLTEYGFNFLTEFDIILKQKL
jgi:hypothetical protein